MDQDHLEDRYVYRNNKMCIHQMPPKWCATCREIEQKKHEQEVNVGIFENLAEWVK